MSSENENQLKPMSKVDDYRRKLVKTTAWAAPGVIAVTLPAHAQTSGICSGTEIAGQWLLTFSDFIEHLNLNADGTGLTSGNIPDSLNWTAENDQVFIEFTRTGRVYQGTIDGSCSNMIGIDTVNNDPFEAKKDS